nr:amino acid adenylation domain-containing protein [Acidimicrobiales bacterium]
MDATPVTLGVTRSPSPMQARLWASQRRDVAAPISNMATRIAIDGPLDPDRFVAAFDAVVLAAEALRTVAAGDGGTLACRVLPAPPGSTEVRDLPASQLEDWCARRVARPLDVTVCAYDSVLLRHDDTSWTWWLDIHHLVTDAVSSALVFEATAAAYAGEPVELDGFEQLRRRQLDGRSTEAWQRARAHWSALAPGPPRPAPYGPPGSRTPWAERLDLGLDPGQLAALDAAMAGPYRSISRELTLLAVLVTAAAELVHRTDGASDVRVGVPVHHRSARHARRVIGPLLELFPLDVSIDPADTHLTLHRRVLRGLVDLLGRAAPDTSPEPDFAVVVNVLTARYGSFAGYPTRAEWVPSGAAEPSQLLRIQAHDYQGDDLCLELDVNEAVGDPTTRSRSATHLRRILLDVVADPDGPIGDVVLPGPDERAEIALLNATGPQAEPTVPVDLLVRHSLVEHRLAPVVQDGATVLTGAELDARADAVAARLVAGGVRVGDRVGLRLARSAEVVVAIQAVLRAGAAFVLLDPEDPPQRHEHILRDAGCRVVLDALPEPVDGDEAVVLPGAAERSIDDLAYVLYTSGSTGEPKGVPILHRGLAGYLRFACDTYVEPGRPPTMALHSSLAFDLTITSLFLPLLVGGRIVVFRGSPQDALPAVAADPRIDLLKATPSQLALVLQLGGELRSVRTLIVGGEAFRRPLALALHAVGHPELAIYNEYGPTEAVVGCMIHRFDPLADEGPDVPIGTACPDCEIHLLDAYGQPVPVGSWGELHVRRPGMATGYLHRPSPDRFGPLRRRGDEIFYRTGDRVRLERPGVAVYGGRSDDQLGLGGIRFEPGEIESALVDHPAVVDAVVRVWRPSTRGRDVARCVRCGLGTDVPGVRLDDAGVCSTCLAFDQVRPQAERWFRTPTDLLAERDAARARRRGAFDCLHLLSGGKDSTYALYQLVEQGWEVHALTLDNGFIAEGAKENIRRTVADLGVSHEFVTTEAMAEIFRDSLERYSNVCNGCYKTIYTLAVNRAHELGIPVVVTGLSRGQFFETRLVPHQFEAGHFIPEVVDAAVLEARKVYHRTPDAVSRLLDTSLFDDDAIFDEIRFVDFYRYVDVEMAELYRFLAERAPWVRPADTGRSTNCLINVAGIAVHRLERGFHNYALPYSWDVKLGHKTREEALDELDDEIDPDEVRRLLDDIGYEPRPREVLTAWYQAEREIDPDELRRHLRERVPAHAVPAAFVRLEELPLAASAKVDVGALPAPTRIHRTGAGYTPPTSPLEERLCELWGEILGLERIGVDDDFFELGGDSLGALAMITQASATLGVDLPDPLAFECRTVRELATAVTEQRGAGPVGAAPSGPSVVGRSVHTGVARDIPPAEGAPLSVGQEALLYEVLADPGSPRFVGTRRYELHGAVDPGRLHDALVEVVARHEPLHRVVTGDRRVLRADDALAWEVVPAGTDAPALAARLAAQPFDPARGPLVRASFVEGVVPQLILSLHHLWCSADSVELLWADLARAYAGERLLAPPVRYSDYAAWERRQDRSAAHAYWRRALPDELRATQLGLARPVPTRADGELRVPVEVDARGQRLFADFLAALDVVLSTYTDDPVVVGVPVGVREHPAVESLVGPFMNQVTLVLPAPGAATFGELASQTRDLLAGALRHRDLPYAEVVADRRHRGLEVVDPVRILAVHHAASRATLPEVVVQAHHVLSGAAVADLSLFLIEGQAGAEVAAEWSGARFDADDVDRLTRAVARVLAEGRERPDRPVADLVAPDRPRDLRGEAPTEPPVPVTEAIWARRELLEPAVSQGAVTLDYAALVQRAERMAAGLVARGVQPGDRVALVLSRSPDQVAAILGVLRARAAYVPIDPAYPPARAAQILTSSAPVLVVTDGTEVVGDHPAIRLVDLAVDDVDGLPASPGPDDPAYVIFTSGSTGRPRGVPVAHEQLTLSTHARDLVYGEAPGRFLWSSSYGFDSSVAGLFWTLVNGGELVLPDDAAATDVDHLLERARSAGITHLLAVPPLWRAMLERGASELDALRWVVVAGEACPTELVDRHLDVLPEVALFNEYGPTEATVWATVHRCRGGEDPVPIGAAVPGVLLRVAGDDLQPRPVGATGELLIGGATLTGGYLDDPVATSARFVVDGAGTRFYRTGDVVRRRHDDVLEFHGRVDEQLSIRGLRIEPDEIERLLDGIPGVRASVVRAEPRRPHDVLDELAALDPAEARQLLRAASDAERPAVALVEQLAVRQRSAPVLVAHVEADVFDEPAARALLRAHLPEAFVPARFVAHGVLPRNVHGKVDRSAIPLAPAAFREAGRVVAAGADSLAERIAALWRDVLELPGLGVDTDLFDAGADSLHALAVVDAMGTVLGVDVGVTDLLRERTPLALARSLSATGRTTP